MDFQEMLETHIESGADATIAGLPVDTEQASSFGIMRLNDRGEVIGFVEKPKTEAELALVRTDPAWLDGFGIESKGRECLASMGIYLFNRDFLLQLLTENPDYEDFGKQIFPLAIQDHKVQMHPFDGYWEDIGTIKSFYDANLQLASDTPPFEFVEADKPIFSRARFLPPTRVIDARVSRSYIADGCIIGKNVTIENSVIGLRTRIGDDVTIKDSFIMGADFYQRPDQLENDRKKGIPHVGIGDGSVIHGAIVDKNPRIGRNVELYNTPDLPELSELSTVVFRDGIVVTEKEAQLPDNWKLGTRPGE
jgi:glucose-1-phosphate adenylyltransferase